MRAAPSSFGAPGARGKPHPARGLRSGPMAPGTFPPTCPRCGALTLAGAAHCTTCGSALPNPAPFGPPGFAGPPRYDPYRVPASHDEEERAVGVVAIVLGAILLVSGVAALAAAAFLHASVASFNSGCQSPCTPAPDPSGAIAAVGIVMLLVGLVVMAVGATHRR